jgi:hypothetical protein
MDKLSSTRLRGATALAILSLCVASVFGAARLTEPVDLSSGARSAVSAAEVTSHSAVLVVRSKLSTSRYAATRSAREWRVIIDIFLLTAGFALAAALWYRRPDNRLHRRLRIDAVFARRRAPPLLHFGS